MSESLAETHPSPERLRCFGCGELRGPEADAIEGHLETCSVCCQRLRELPRDPLLKRLQAVIGAEEIESPPTTGLNRPTACDSQASTPADSKPVPQLPPVPPALAEHPRYRVLKALGGGGMGTVYLAEHKMMKRLVALKVIRPDLTARPEVSDRFRREVEAAARLTHPNIVAAHDAEQAGDCLFLVMEFVEGTDLAAWLATHSPLPVPEACDSIRQAALGLQHAHERGMIHRDLKPQNLMRTPTGQVKILDFGLARLVELAQEGGTPVGMVLGTPDYVAPEQANDAHGADIRADVYSLGCTLYHLLSGQVPFPGGGLLDKLRRLAQEQPESLARLRPDLPAPLAAVVEWMMAKDPARRPQTPAEVAAALAPWCQLLAHVSNGPTAPSGTEEMAGQDPLPASRPGPDMRSRKRWHRFIRQPVFLLATVALLLVLGAGLAYFATTGAGIGQRRGELKAGDRAPDLSKVIPLIDDDFSGPNGNYFGGRLGGPDKKIEDFRVENGLFVMQSFPVPPDKNWPDQQSVSSAESRRQPATGDFACQVVGRVTTGGDHGWGLGLYSGSEDYDLAVRLRRDGGVEVGNFRWGRDRATTMAATVPPIRPPAFMSGDVFNKLLVVCRGGRKLEIYVNNSAIGPPIVLDRLLLPPVHQFMVFWKRGRDTNVEGRAECKRFTLWELPPAAPAVP